MLSRIENAIQALGLQPVETRPVPESFSSEVTQIILHNGESVYLKIPYNRNKLYREVAMLNRLRAYQLPVPRVLDVWEGDEQHSGALLLEALEGRPLTDTEDTKLAYAIGELHARLHSVPMPGYGEDSCDGFHYLDNQDWRGYIRRQYEKCQAPCRELLPEGLYEACLKHFDSVFRSLPKPDGPCVIHMDFRPGNLLIDHSRLIGVIDFESSRGGSSESDFTKIPRYLWREREAIKQAYIEGYNSIRPMMELDLVLPFYSFYDAFSAVVWCNKRGLDRNRQFFEENIAILCRETGWNY